MALTNSAPNAASHAGLADITEISAGNGYTAGGATTTITTSRSGGTAKAAATDVTWTASGGSIGPFRYAVIYNDTSASDSLIAYWDYGTNLTVTSGNSFTVDFDASSGVLTVV